MTRDFAEEHQEKLFALLLVLAEREKQMLESKTSGLASEKQTRAAEIVRLKAQSQGICQSTSSTSAFLEFRKPQTPLDAQQRLNSLQANFRYRSACHSLLSGIQTIIQKHSSEILSLDKEREALLPPIQRQTAKISVLS